MKKQTTLTLIVLTVLILAMSSASGAQTTNHRVYWIEEGAPGGRVAGARATSIREEDGFSLIINTKHLVPGPVTVWMFFFTCDPADENCAPTNGGMFATADTITSNGKGHFAVGVPETSPHLTDAETDEVHVIIVDGKPGDEPMWLRLTTPSGGTFRQVVIVP